MADADRGLLLLAEAADINFSPVQPEVADNDYAGPSLPAIPYIGAYIQPFEFREAKDAVLSYLYLCPSSKLSECQLKTCIEAVCKLLYDPALSSPAYDRLCIIKDHFPQLATEFHKAQLEKETAKRLMVYLKCVNDDIKIDLEAYKKLEDIITFSESEHGKNVESTYPAYEVASMRFESAKRDISKILKDVEDLCTDIRLSLRYH